MRDVQRFGLSMAVLCLSLTATGQARAGVVTFSGDSTGGKPNGFTSVESPVVHFTDSMGANLDVENYGIQSIGNGLGVFGDDASQLIIDFDLTVHSLSLVFGNDDPGFSSPGDIALLTAFNGTTQVGQASVVLNRNDIADQTISLAGFDFNRATFVYANSSGTPISLIEIVDNVTFLEGPAAVPEPSTLAMGTTAVLLSLTYAWRRRRRSSAA